MNVDLGSLKTGMPKGFRGGGRWPEVLTVIWEVLTILGYFGSRWAQQKGMLAQREGISTTICVFSLDPYLMCILTIELQLVQRTTCTAFIEHCGPLPNLPN